MRLPKNSKKIESIYIGDVYPFYIGINPAVSQKGRVMRPRAVIRHAD